jgi:glycosyltransferase involved in cell wall biosynthesis
MTTIKRNLLIIGSSQGVYGGIEAFMMAVAEAAQDWEEFDVKLCFKLVQGAAADQNLMSMAGKSCKSVYYVHRGSKDLLKLIKWADVLHAQNMPPDIVFPAYLRRKRINLTIHNRRQEKFSMHNFVWGITNKLANRRWFNSRFVWNTWEPGKKSAASECVPTVCKLPGHYVLPEDRKGFLFVGRWIENKGIEELIKAYKICNLNSSDWPLTILGDGPIREKVHALLKEYNLHDVLLPGFVDNLEKERILASTKWILAPAKTQEDLGLTPIEARSVGVPAIVTRDGGLPESGGPSALIAEPGNVDDLVRCMRIAVGMSAKDYQDRSFQGKEELKTFLKPMEFYKQAFLN